MKWSAKINQLARKAYTEWKGNDNPFDPPWSELDEDQQDRWRRVVSVVLNVPLPKARKPRKANTGHCPVCGYGVKLGARNRTLTHALVRRGRIVGRCPGSGKTTKPEHVAIYRLAMKPDSYPERWSKAYAKTKRRQGPIRE